MEQQLIKQLERNGVSFQQLKAILDDIESKRGGEETTVNVSKSGLRVLKCKGCHKNKWESEFKLNSIHRRYRSCSDCVLRATRYRQKKRSDVIVGGNANNIVKEAEEQQTSHETEGNENVIPQTQVEEHETDVYTKPKSILKKQSRTTLLPPNDDTIEYVYHVKHNLPKDKHVKFNVITSSKNEIYNIKNTWYDHIEPHTNISDYPCFEDNITPEDDDDNISDIQPLRLFNLF